MEINQIQELVNTLSFSHITWQILTPIIFSLCDIITGFIGAKIKNNISSSVMRKGLLHKALILIVLILSFIIDISFNLSFVSKFVSIYICVMECISIIENLKKSGINIPIFTNLIFGKEEEKK